MTGHDLICVAIGGVLCSIATTIARRVRKPIVDHKSVSQLQAQRRSVCSACYTVPCACAARELTKLAIQHGGL